MGFTGVTSMVSFASTASMALSLAFAGGLAAQDRKPVSLTKATASCSAPLSKPADVDKMVELKIQPSKLVLNGLTDARRLLVSARLADGRHIDVSRSAKLTALDDRIRIGSDGFLSPIKDGESR